MFICDFCSLQFDTEEEFNVHTNRCTANVAGPSSGSVKCNYCNKSFFTTELSDHSYTCEGFINVVLSQIATTVNEIDYYTENVLKDKPNQCQYCPKQLNTMGELIMHRKECGVLKLLTALSKYLQTARRRKESGSGDVLSMPLEAPPGTPPKEISIFDLVKNLALPVISEFERSRQSTSNESAQTQSSRKRALETETERDTVTQFESNPEKKQKPNFECDICSLTFQSLDEFQTHVLQCREKTKK